MMNLEILNDKENELNNNILNGNEEKKIKWIF